MARIVVFRDGQVSHEIDVDQSMLATRDLRVGRDKGSDIVLDDPEKTVSRQHAELRFEHGEYVLLDLGSPNGIWVGGERVQRVVLNSGVRVTVGPYEITLEERAAEGVPTPGVSAASASKTSPMIEAVRVEPPGTVPPGSPTPIAARPGHQKKRRAPISQTSQQPGVIAWLARQPKPIVFGIFFAVVILVMAMGLLFSPVEDSGVAGSAAPPGAPPIESATNEELIAELLANAQASLVRGEFDKTIEYLDRVLLIDQNHPDALDIKARVEQGLRLAGRPRVAEEPAEAAEAETEAEVAAQAAAERLRLQRAAAQRAREREAELQGRLDEARTLLNAQEFPAAISALEAIVQDEPDHADAAALLATAREDMTAAGRKAFDRAVRAEAESEWEEAIEGYERARILDDAIFGVDAAIGRVRERMLEAGTDAYKRARQYDALGRIPEAVALYERAIRLLPPDHSEHQPAQERLSRLSPSAR